MYTLSMEVASAAVTQCNLACHVLNLCVCVCVSLAFRIPIRSLAVGTKTGYRLFSVTSVDKLDCIHESGESVPVCRPIDQV